MDERHDPLSEADERVVAMAEAEIRRALLVEPSLEFQAKVRARITAQPRRTFGSHPWFALAAAASMGGALAALMMFELRPGTPTAPIVATAPRPSPAEPPHAPQVIAATQPPEVAPPLPAGRPQPVRHRDGAVAALHDGVTPEVLIDPAQAAAVRRLFAMTQRGIKLPEGAGKEIVVAGELLVSPLVVEPLQVPAITAEQGPGSDKKSFQLPASSFQLPAES